MRNVLAPIVAAVALAGLAACGTETTTQLTTDATVSQDVAASAASSVDASLTTMANNETSTGLSSVQAPRGLSLSVLRPSYTFTENRTRTCYDANKAVVAGCSPMSSVRTIVTHVSVDGSRSGTNSTTGGSTITWSGALHRVSNDSLTRVFNTASPPAETQRVHNDNATEHDTTSFSDGSASRNYAEAGHDSVEALTFNLPRASNPNPVSGKIVRLDTVHVVTTKSGVTETKDAVRRVEIDFPADAQGNVTIIVTGGGVTKTCTYNINTHTMGACQ